MDFSPSSYSGKKGGQCFKGDKVTQGELGMPGHLGGKVWLLPKASWVCLDA